MHLTEVSLTPGSASVVQPQPHRVPGAVRHLGGRGHLRRDQGPGLPHGEGPGGLLERGERGAAEAAPPLGGQGGHLQGLQDQVAAAIFTQIYIHLNLTRI